MGDDTPDTIPSFARVSVAAVLVFEGEDPNSALTQAGILDPIAVEVRIGETEDPSQGFLGDGVTPNLRAILETDQGDQRRDASSGGVDASSIGRIAARSAATNPPLPSGNRPFAPVRGSGTNR